MNMQTDQTEADNHKKRNDIQREMIMLESDLKKIMNQKANINAEKRRLEKDIERLKLEFFDRQNKEHSFDQEISVKQEHIRRLKKQLNIVH